MSIRLRIFLFILLASACAGAVRAADSAASLLERCAEKLAASPSVSARFTVRASDGGDTAGEIVVARERFRMSSPQLHIWFDGRTQGSALAAAKEVNITEPTAEELLTTNPFAIITGYAGRYNCRLLPHAAGTPANVKQVELIPRQGTSGDIRRAVISIDTRTLWPVKAVVTMASGATVAATVTGCAVGGKLPVSAFTFKPSALPGYEVVDLR